MVCLSASGSKTRYNWPVTADEHRIAIAQHSWTYSRSAFLQSSTLTKFLSAEINAAVTLTSLIRSGLFDLRETYFLIGGIGGINPELGTTGSVTFARYAIQVALQYEFDAREKPENFSTGYFPQDAQAPNQYPGSIYGTEVFEVNDALRQIAIGFASKASLNDSATAATYRANYAKSRFGQITGPSATSFCAYCVTAT